MCLETLLLVLQLACIAIVCLGTALWTIGLLPARGQAVLAFLSDALDAVFLSLASGETTARPSAPRCPLPAPLSPAYPLFSPLARPGDTFPASAPLSPCVWEKPLPFSAPPTASIDEVFARLHAWFDRPRVEMVQRRQQKKTVRFAREVQVREISPTSPRPAPSGACPPVVEPFDPVAWLARLEAFSAAIHQPDCSVLAALGLVGPVQQQQQQPPPAPTFFPAGIPQPAPSVVLPPPSPPKAAPAPASAPAAPTTAACEPEKPQQAPLPPCAPKAASPPPSPAPAAPPAQTSSAAAPASKAAPTFSFAAANPPSAPETKQPFKFDRSSLFSAIPGLAAPADLSPTQTRIRDTLERTMDLVAHLTQRAPTYAALFPAGPHRARNALLHSWVLFLRHQDEKTWKTGEEKVAELAGELRWARETLTDDLEGLRESVVPRGMLEAVLLKGKRFEELGREVKRVYDLMRESRGENTDEIVARDLTTRMPVEIGKLRGAVEGLKGLLGE